MAESILEFSDIMGMPILEQEVLILRQNINDALFQILFNISFMVTVKTV
ncbi:hypothetical protein [Bartonella sp. 1-1C]|nr:hypothetical protein [Bartonella sp. 1-1C]